MDVKEYIDSLPEERQAPMLKLMDTIIKNLPKGFEKEVDSKGIAYNVPLSIYPDGYHVTSEALPFIGLMNHKGHIGFYHMGIYGDKELLDWFTNEYSKLNIGKLDMGKSCIRLKKMNNIPYELLGELCKKVSIKEYISLYEKTFKQG